MLHTPDGASQRVELFRPPAAKVGGLPLSGVESILCRDLSFIREHAGTEMSGFIGMDFLGNRIVRIDFDRGEVAFLKSVPQDSGRAISLGLSPHSIPTAALDIIGVGRRSFLVDTGFLGDCSGTMHAGLLDPMIAGGHAAVVGTKLAKGLIRSSVVREVRVQEVSLCGFRHRGMVFAEREKDMLGLRYLSRFVVTLDFRRMKMYLTPGKRFHEPDCYNLSGAGASRSNGVTIVYSVHHASAADKAGLRVGDAIEQFDGRPAESMSLLQIRKRLCTPGEHYLRVRRAQQSLNLVLVLRGN
jgi:hypothetical protein